LNIQRFEFNKTSLNLIQDVNTRWNNIFLMMKRVFALKMNVINWLNREFSNFNQKRRTRDIFKKLIMIEIEWKKIKYMMNLLRSFYQWTQEIDQSRDLIIQFAFFVYNNLFDHLENQKKSASSRTYLDQRISRRRYIWRETSFLFTMNESIKNVKRFII
jgi:ribosomal protein S15P/S13E